MSTTDRYPGMTIRPRPPLLIRLAQRTSRWYRIRNAMARLGWLEGAAHFAFHDTTVAAPLRESEAWRYGPLRNYNRATTQNFAAISDRLLGDFDYVDCGAHLGLFGAQFVTFSKHCRRATAIEPNPSLFPFLKGNLQAGQTTDIVTIMAAIGDFTGRGRLCAPAYDPRSDHALYLVPDPAGPIEVVRLDSLADRIGPRAAIKLDIEGQERAVLEAATGFLRARERVVLCVELHRDVLARVGQTDRELLLAINAIRSMIWADADHPDRILDLSRPILPQTGNTQQCDAIGWDA